MDGIGALVASALCRERRIMPKDGADDALDTNISGQSKHGQTTVDRCSKSQDGRVARTIYFCEYKGAALERRARVQPTKP